MDYFNHFYWCSYFDKLIVIIMALKKQPLFIHSVTIIITIIIFHQLLILGTV